METKICTGCQLLLCITSFGGNGLRNGRPRISCRCRGCRSNYAKRRYLANPEKAKARSRRYHQRHLAKCNEIAKAWRKANPDKVKANNRKCSQSDPSRYKRYRQANPDKVRATKRAHRDAAPEKNMLTKMIWDFRRRNEPTPTPEILSLMVLHNLVKRELRKQTKPTK